MDKIQRLQQKNMSLEEFRQKMELYMMSQLGRKKLQSYLGF